MDLTQRAVLNEAARHDAAVTALGGRTKRTPGLWTSPEVVGGPFHSAIVLSPPADPAATRAAIEELRGMKTGPLGVLDPWSSLNLEDLGFRAEEREHYVRSPGRAARPAAPPELSIEPVATAAALAELERADALGFESDPPDEPFGSYSPHLLKDQRFRFFVGRVEGFAVSVSQAVIAAGVVGIYGVATLPAYRRRGYGRALAWAATLVRPDLPAVLEPTAVAARMYRHMGYRAAGSHRAWLAGVGS